MFGRGAKGKSGKRGPKRRDGRRGPPRGPGSEAPSKPSPAKEAGSQDGAPAKGPASAPASGPPAPAAPQGGLDAAAEQQLKRLGEQLTRLQGGADGSRDEVKAIGEKLTRIEEQLQSLMVLSEAITSGANPLAASFMEDRAPAPPTRGHARAAAPASPGRAAPQEPRPADARSAKAPSEEHGPPSADGDASGPPLPTPEAPARAEEPEVQAPPQVTLPSEPPAPTQDDAKAPGAEPSMPPRPLPAAVASRAPAPAEATPPATPAPQVKAWDPVAFQRDLVEAIRASLLQDSEPRQVGTRHEPAPSIAPVAVEAMAQGNGGSWPQGKPAPRATGLAQTPPALAGRGREMAVAPPRGLAGAQPARDRAVAADCPACAEGDDARDDAEPEAGAPPRAASIPVDAGMGASLRPLEGAGGDPVSGMALRRWVDQLRTATGTDAARGWLSYFAATGWITPQLCAGLQGLLAMLPYQPPPTMRPDATAIHAVSVATLDPLRRRALGFGDGVAAGLRAGHGGATAPGRANGHGSPPGQGHTHRHDGGHRGDHAGSHGHGHGHGHGHRHATGRGHVGRHEPEAGPEEDTHAGMHHGA